MRTLHLILAAWLIEMALASCPSQPSPTALAPSQEMISDVNLNEAISLAGRWRSRPVELFNEEMAQPGFDDSEWAEVDAPAAWDAQGMADLTGKAAVVVYRRQVEVPAVWQGKRVGISAWFNPHSSQVFVNGQRVEPERKPFAPFADVSVLLRYGQMNTLAVTTIYDGYFEMAEAGPPRIGLITERPVTRVLHEDVTIATPDGSAEATLIRPAVSQGLPALILIATGSHGLPEKTAWFDFADDLARQGYVCLALALPVQRPAGALAAVEYLRSLTWVNPRQIVLFGADEGAKTAMRAAEQDVQIRGVILLSPPMQEPIGLGHRPVLILASREDRRGLVLEQAQAIAEQVQGPYQLVALPGDGHGTFVFTSAWNAARRAVMEWLPSATSESP
ncbi:MAG: hypothetical protein RML36_01015 [Anaerolineae bacterium]|nr:hypothetical protein [Anaerolineae bacterium]MDW8098048.1 hypothetical protein [Anaerolineae bacterium]